MITIHKLSKTTGISVRTLRYYEEIGLLFPSAKTVGGHRLYGEEELKELQQIVFLKTLEFQLKEIQSHLSDKWDWSASLNHQLAFVLEEQEKLKLIEKTIRNIQNIKSTEELSEHLLHMIRLTNRGNNLKEDLRR